MQNDHHDTLIRYLAHHAHLSPFAARTARLHDITFSSLTILTSHPFTSRSPRRHIIPITPPLTNWSDARARLVAMDNDAITALGRSRITVKRYVPPRSAAQVVLFGVIAAIFVVFLRVGNFRAGSWVYEGGGLGYVPRFAGFCEVMQPWVLGLLVGAHVLEAGVLVRGRLVRHSVTVGGLVWWAWVMDCFVEGGPAFRRFDEYVRGEEEMREKKEKH